jgi:glutamine synthetase
MTSVHQFVPTLAPRDAVGRHYLAVQEALRGAGYRSDIYAYEAKDVPRVPTSLHEAVDAFEQSQVAREAFGDFVFEHVLNTARQEQVIFDNNCVTDWELARYFERG